MLEQGWNLTLQTELWVVPRIGHPCSTTFTLVCTTVKSLQWSDVWPSMFMHTRNLCSAFNPSKCTHSTEHTHPEQWAAILLRGPRSSWGFHGLLKSLTTVMVLKVERALVIHSPHRQFLPDLRLKPATFGLKVWLSNHYATTGFWFPSSWPN